MYCKAFESDTRHRIFPRGLDFPSCITCGRNMHYTTMETSQTDQNVQNLEIDQCKYNNCVFNIKYHIHPTHLKV